jgi:hypothetical protein
VSVSSLFVDNFGLSKMLTFWNRFDVCILRPRTGRPLVLDKHRCLKMFSVLEWARCLRFTLQNGPILFHAGARFHVSCYRGLLASGSKSLLGFKAPSIARPPRKDRCRRANLWESFRVETKRRGNKVWRVSERARERDWEIVPAIWRKQFVVVSCWDLRRDDEATQSQLFSAKETAKSQSAGSKRLQPWCGPTYQSSGSQYPSWLQVGRANRRTKSKLICCSLACCILQYHSFLGLGSFLLPAHDWVRK